MCLDHFLVGGGEATAKGAEVYLQGERGGALAMAFDVTFDGGGALIAREEVGAKENEAEHGGGESLEELPDLAGDGGSMEAGQTGEDRHRHALEDDAFE